MPNEGHSVKRLWGPLIFRGTANEEIGRAQMTLAFPLRVPKFWSLLPELFLVWRVQIYQSQYSFNQYSSQYLLSSFHMPGKGPGLQREQSQVVFPQEWAVLWIIAALAFGKHHLCQLQLGSRCLSFSSVWIQLTRIKHVNNWGHASGLVLGRESSWNAYLGKGWSTS